MGIHRRNRERYDPIEILPTINYNNSSQSKRKAGDTWPRHGSMYSSIRSIRSSFPLQAASFFMWLLNGNTNSTQHDHAASFAAEGTSASLEDAEKVLNEGRPFHKQFHGGLKSSGAHSPDVEYEVELNELECICMLLELASLIIHTKIFWIHQQ